MAERMIILPATLALTIEKQAVGSSDFTFAEILDKMATARTHFVRKGVQMMKEWPLLC